MIEILPLVRVLFLAGLGGGAEEHAGSLSTVRRLPGAVG